MRRILFTVLLTLLACGLTQAQTIYLCKDGHYITKSITEGLSVDLTQGYDSITFSRPQMDFDVTIAYAGNTATVSIPEELAEEVVCTSGNSSNVVITNSNTFNEVTYKVSGSSTAGSLTITQGYKMKVQLNGVNLTSTTGAAVNIQCGKRIDVIMQSGSTNSFTDYAGGTQKACFYTKGHVELSGAGTLNVTGNRNHAIASKEYFQVKKTVKAINILKAANDAIHCGQYFQMNGGTLTIDENTANDGIQVEYKTDDNDEIIEDVENTGLAIIKGGTFNITLNNNQDAKGIKTEGGIDISGGTFLINAVSKGSRGMQTDGNMNISQNNATTDIKIYAKGGPCTLEEDEDDPHKCMGIKVDGNLTITGGTVTVIQSGSKSKGIKVKGAYTKTGGTVNGVVDNE